MTTNHASSNGDAVLDSWIQRETMAEKMIPLIGRLYRENNVILSVHGRSLINQSAVSLLKAHRFARKKPCQCSRR